MRKYVTRHRSRGGRDQRGFTLVELVVVIAIIGIVLLIAIPNFTRMQRQARTRSALQKTAQHFKMLRERAISTGGTYAIIFPDHLSYRLYRPDSTTQVFKLNEVAGGRVYFGGVNVAGQPPEANMAAPGNNGIDFPGGQLIIDARGGATSGVVYITDGIDNYAVGVNSLGKIETYTYASGYWNP